MLTQEQMQRIIVANHGKDLYQLLQAAYATGMAAGEAKERDRCVQTLENTSWSIPAKVWSNMSKVAIEKATVKRCIEALKEQK